MLNVLKHCLKKKKKMMTNNSKITVELLEENHPIKPFDCEDEDLNEFLFQEAIPYRKEMLATTFIIENKERTLGYYSLLNDSLQLKEESLLVKVNIINFAEIYYLIQNGI